MKYSIDTINEGWTVCEDGSTPFLFPDTGNYELIVCDTILADTTRFFIPAKAEAPLYSINYGLEQTNEVLASTDAYSWNVDLSASIAGNDINPVSLDVVGVAKSLYLFTMPTDTTVISKADTLLVKGRPLAPVLNIDYINESTADLYGDTLRYAHDSLFSDMQSDSYGYITLVPSDTLWFFYNSTSYNFKSDTSFLIISSRPDTPDVVINYNSETLTNVTGSVEWTTGSVFSPLTNNESITGIIPASSLGNDTALIYVSAVANSHFRSDTQKLIIPKRYPAPSITEDDVNDEFSWTYVGSFTDPTEYEYSTNGGTGYGPCSTNPESLGAIDLAAGQLLVRLKSGVDYFAGEADASTIAFTAVGALPLSGVDVHIDSAKLTGTTTEMEYSLNSTDGKDGNWTICGDPETTLLIDSAGGFNVYVRQAADTTNNQLVRAILVAAPAPDYTINYVNETTAEIIPATAEFAWHTDWSDKTDGPGTVFDLSSAVGTKDTAVYFRIKATQYTVASLSQSLPISSRPTISYTVNYNREKTNEIVPSDVKYSEMSDMSASNPGLGDSLSVTPGTDYWLQKDADGSNFSSQIFHLVVTSRPAAPVYIINYAAETTVEVIPDTVEWDSQSNMAGAQVGGNIALPLDPSTSYYFRYKSTAYHFKSETSAALTTPARAVISYGTDYDLEETKENIPTDVWYADNAAMSSSVQGNNVPISVTPGSDVWFRKESGGGLFASDTFRLVVDVRPTAPAYTLNYSVETTNEIVPDTVEWDTQSSMASAQVGGNIALPLDPSTSYYFRYKSTAYHFKSVTSVALTTPARALISYGIDYDLEETKENIPTDVWYANNAAMSSSVQGNNVPISVTPGSDVWFLKESGGGLFASDTFHLEVDVRPTAPAYTLNYAAETTNEIVPDTVEWDSQSNMSGAQVGGNIALPLDPSTSYYFRYKSGVTHFKSDTSAALTTPARAVIGYSIDYDLEETKENIPTDVWYADNAAMSSSVQGNNVPISVTPGTDLWFWKENDGSLFASDTVPFAVPDRPATPSVSIDYETETVSGVASNTQWNASGSMTGLADGASLTAYIPANGELVKTINVEIDTTAGSFRSEQQTLTLNPRSAAPVITSYNDVSEPNTFTFTPVSGFANPSDYEYKYNSSAWMPCTTFSPTIQSDVAIPIGDLKVRLKASSSALRFAGMEFASTKAYSSIVATDLNSVGIDISAGLITNTTTAMEYSFDSTDGTDGNWSPAENGNTVVSFDAAGGYPVYIRQIALQENYRLVYSVVAQLPAPTYEVDYYTERTKTGIAATDEYSWNADFSSLVQGTGATVALNPGSVADTLYIRTSATSTAVASSVQSLRIKTRPVVTDYTLDYVNEKTKQTVPSTVEWDNNAVFSSPAIGDGSNVGLSPGTTYYFRIKATDNSFKSLVDQVAVPSRPTINFSVDYINETTNEPVPAGVIYDDNISFGSPQNGTGIKVPVTPGTNMYLKQVAVADVSLASSPFTLTVSGRPSSVSYSIDYVNEKTTTTVPSTVEWSNQPDFSTSIPGSGTYVNLDPEKTYYFRRKATITTFASLATNFTVPARPVFTIGINYPLERTNAAVPSTVIYAYNSGFSSSQHGTGSSIVVTPGVNLWFMQEALPFTSYASDPYELVVPARPIPTAYTIDYFNETTNELIPSTVQWSLSAGMTDPNTGTGSVISILPATKYYFREKATPTKFESEVSAPLEVPAREDISFTVNYTNEHTSELVTNAYSWSYNSDMSGATSGSGTYLALSPGVDVYFRKKAQDGVAYKSNIFQLNVPDRPASVSYETNYVTEKTKSIVPTTVEWSNQSNMTSPQSGTGQELPLTPDTNYFFRVKSTNANFVSETSPELYVPLRPSLNVTIDYVQEQTNQIVYSNTIWSKSSDLSNPTTGTGTVVPITPGQDMWFIKPPVPDVSLKSNTVYLDVSGRPVSPTFSIDYTNETTTAPVPTTVEWSTQPDMTGSTTGTDAKITLDPSTSYYFRTKATSTTFASAVSPALAVPSRPDLNFTIDYFNERTNEVVETDVYWADNENMIGATQGNGAVLPLTPGQDIWFRKKASVDRYSSQIFHLIVPPRPDVPSVQVNYIDETIYNVPGYCQWDVTGPFTDVFTNASLTAYIPGYGNPVKNIVFKVKATASSFVSGAQVLTIPARKQAPTIVFYNDATDPNSFTYSFIFGYIQYSDYEYNINNTSWEPTTNITQEVPSDLQILAGDLLLRLAADNDEPRFAGESYASTVTFTGTPPLDLSTVDLDLIASQITGTTNQMEYSLNSTNGTNGTWTTCSNGNTSISYDILGGFKVYVRQTDLTGNKRLIYNVAVQADAPSYSIDYINETLNDPLDSGDEMTWNSNLTGFVKGDGVTEPALNITTSGTTAYIRTALSQYVVASKVQSLTIPAREVLSYTINFINETTNQTIDSDVEWALNSGFTNYNVGAGTVIPVTPSQNMWFKRRAHIDQFESAVYELVVPARRTPIPSFTIDFANKTTAENIADTVVYSTMSDMSSAVQGTGAKVAVTPGTSLFFRTKASVNKFASAIFELAAPYPPAAPDPGIDYVNEALINIEEACEWYMNSSYEPISEGENISAFVPSSVEPANELQVRYKATDNSFASPDKTVTLNPRIQAPAILTIDDEGDSLTWSTISGYAAPGLYQYSVNNGSTWNQCDSSTIFVGDIIIPVGSFKLRLKGNNTAGSEHFASDAATNDVAFTAIALIGLDSVYVNIVKGLLTGTSTEMEYSLTSTDGENGDWITALDDTTFVDYPIDGGYKVFIRQKNKTLNFSEVFDVETPRPAPDFSIDFYTEYLDQAVADTIQISAKSDMEDVIAGQNNAYRIIPGKKDSFIYLRVVADSLRVPSEIQQLYIPARPDAPQFTINFPDEATNEILNDSIEWADNSDMTNAKAGEGTRLALNPQDKIDSLYFRLVPTDTSFASDKLLLILPARPVTPDVGINYVKEIIYDVPTGCQWDISGNFEPVADSLSLVDYIPASNENEVVAVFKILSTSSTFASLPNSVTIKPRSQAPSFTAYNDVFDTFTFDPLTGIGEAGSYEYSLDNGVTWSVAEDFTVEVGNINLDAGVIKLRVKADDDNERFNGEAASSTQAYTYTDILSFEVVNVDLLTNTLSGTSQLMQYSILPKGSNDTIWVNCNDATTEFEYSSDGDFGILMRQIGKEFNQDMILYVDPPASGPKYRIDFYNEQLAEPVSSSDEYATQSDMGDAVAGDDVTVLALEPDHTDSVLYFRTMATQTTLASHISELIIPARPDLNMGIDFENEVTSRMIPDVMIWWTKPDQSDSLKGENVVIPVEPEDKIWFLQYATDTSFKSYVDTLIAPARPEAPVFTIDFYNETTMEIASDAVIWSLDAGFTVKNKAGNDVIPLSPGKDTWFAYEATDTSYSSPSYMLEVPIRPDKPDRPVIDYENELLTGLTTEMQVVVGEDVYQLDQDWFNLTDIIQDNSIVTIEARIESDGETHFASESQFVVIPSRPELPFVKLQHVVSDKGAIYVNSRKATASDNLEYKIDIGDWTPIDDNTIIEIGGDREILVRLAATSSSFRSVPSGNLNFKLDAQLIDLIVVDGMHDSRLIIGGLQYFPDNKIRIFTRWGDMIYEVDNYQNEFDFANYPAGTYYYTVSYTDEGVRKEYRNYVEVIKK
ncbi:gliding motility-associated C-terminal domain-containing protein [Saccharicrinis sp. FJH62]|uniref:T9SS type B sorting domain-containing protein n=1 Tax=Saccharicrinis sp. FJH62 TaxID=3344657 RepID=UPI0035D3E063